MQVVRLPYKETSLLADRIITMLEGEGIPLGMGIVAAMLVMVRLTEPELGEEKEITFIQHLSDWLGVYFTEGQVH